MHGLYRSPMPTKPRAEVVVPRGASLFYAYKTPVLQRGYIFFNKTEENRSGCKEKVPPQGCRQQSSKGTGNRVPREQAAEFQGNRQRSSKGSASGVPGKGASSLKGGAVKNHIKSLTPRPIPAEGITRGRCYHTTTPRESESCKPLFHKALQNSDGTSNVSNTFFGV